MDDSLVITAAEVYSPHDPDHAVATLSRVWGGAYQFRSLAEPLVTHPVTEQQVPFIDFAVAPHADEPDGDGEAKERAARAVIVDDPWDAASRFASAYAVGLDPLAAQNRAQAVRIAELEAQLAADVPQES